MEASSGLSHDFPGILKLRFLHLNKTRKMPRLSWQTCFTSIIWNYYPKYSKQIHSWLVGKYNHLYIYMYIYIYTTYIMSDSYLYVSEYVHLKYTPHVSVSLYIMFLFLRLLISSHKQRTTVATSQNTPLKWWCFQRFAKLNHFCRGKQNRWNHHLSSFQSLASLQPRPPVSSFDWGIIWSKPTPCADAKGQVGASLLENLKWFASGEQIIRIVPSNAYDICIQHRRAAIDH